MGNSRVQMCEVCRIAHGKYICPAQPGTLERVEWELGKKDGYEDAKIGTIDYTRAIRSPFYYAGYRQSVKFSIRMDECQQARDADRDH
jgi:hypothetical protein